MPLGDGHFRGELRVCMHPIRSIAKGAGWGCCRMGICRMGTCVGSGRGRGKGARAVVELQDGATEEEAAPRVSR
jgi:hypothetical protein